MSVYVYGVVGVGACPDLDDGGMGPVRVVERGGLAALCSDVADDPVGRRRELKAHADVLSAACLRTAVVPFSFGTVLLDDEAVRTRLLQRYEGHLRVELDRLRDVLQLNVRLVPDEQRLLADVIAGSPELARLNDTVRAMPPGVGQAQRLRLGEAVANAYRVAGERIGRAVVDSLSRGAVDVRVEEIGGQEATTRAAFLVERRRVSEFLGGAQNVSEGFQGRLTCRVVGPLPPFTFVAPLEPGQDDAQLPESSWVS